MTQQQFQSSFGVDRAPTFGFDDNNSLAVAQYRPKNSNQHEMLLLDRNALAMADGTEEQL